MKNLELDDVINILKEFSEREHKRTEIILIGALALQYYGYKDRATRDIDAEVKGDNIVEELIAFLNKKGIPADIGEDVSGWSIIALPENYRKRASLIYKDKYLTLKVINQLDLIIAKLRRFTEDDIKDAEFLLKKFNISKSDIIKAALDSINHSPKDTALFIFKKNIEIFLEDIFNLQGKEDNI